MADTYEELICRLCKLRDQLKGTEPGREALRDVKWALRYMRRYGVSWEKALEKARNAGR